MTDQTPDPNDFADTLEAQMIADYVSGGMTLVDAARTLEIPLRTVYNRIYTWPRFAEMMEAARTAGFDVIASDIRRVTRGEPGYSSGDPKRDKLIAEMDLKLLSKWHPKAYGEKLQVEQKTATVAIPVSDDPVVAQRAYEDLMKG